MSPGHNIFLDVVLEQGPLGFIAIVMVFLGSFVLLAQKTGGGNNPQLKRSQDWFILHLGILASLVVMLVHGLFEDTVYGSQFSMFLFVVFLT